MVSYKLITENRSALYYNKYEYKVRFKIKLVGRARYCTDIYSFNQKIKDLRNRGWISNSYYPNASNISNIEKFLNWRNTLDKSKAMLRIDTNSFTVYSNDLSILTDLLNNTFNTVDFKVCRSNATGESGVIYFKRTPPSNYRVYFKFAKVNDNFCEVLQEVLQRYENSGSPLVPNKSLKRWMNKISLWSRNYVSNSFSIGYNNEADLLLLTLTMPEVIGAHFKLEKRNDP